MPLSEIAPDDPTSSAEFATVFGSAVATRNLTLERLSQRLRTAGMPVSIATLSYWQTGRSLPTRARSLKAVAELERILQVEPGHLTGALPGDVVSRWDPIMSISESEQIAEVLAQMGLSRTSGMSSQMIHDAITINADETTQTEHTRQLLASEVDGFDRYPLVFTQETAEEQVPPWIEAVSGCELGQLVQLEDLGITAAEIILPHRLAKGELAMVEYTVHWDTAHEEEHAIARGIGTGMRYHIIDILFEGRIPTTVERYSAAGSAVIDAMTAPSQPLTPGRFVQRVIADPQAGLHGIRWSY